MTIEQRAAQDRINARLARILLDLHRCDHGRLQGDPCVGCGGPSGGNPHLRPGSVIGYNRFGDEIAMPSIGKHNAPDSWATGR